MACPVSFWPHRKLKMLEFGSIHMFAKAFLIFNGNPTFVRFRLWVAPCSCPFFHPKPGELPEDSTQYTAPLRGGRKIDMVCLLCTVASLAFFDSSIFIFAPKNNVISKKTTPSSCPYSSPPGQECCRKTVHSTQPH